MDLDKETQQKIQELQSLEQNLHGLLMQKQAFQMELSESESALAEVSDSKEDVFKLVGQVMIKTDKEKIVEELKKKQELLSLRLKAIESQESSLTKQAEELRDEVTKKLR
jgi:prefoldin beta subunit